MRKANHASDELNSGKYIYVDQLVNKRRIVLAALTSVGNGSLYPGCAIYGLTTAVFPSMKAAIADPVKDLSRDAER